METAVVAACISEGSHRTSPPKNDAVPERQTPKCIWQSLRHHLRGGFFSICSVTVDVPFITQFHLHIIVCAKCTKLIASFKENFVERKDFGLVFGSFCGIFRDTMKNIDSTAVYVRVEKNRANSLIWADALFCSTVFYGSAVL